MLSLITILLLTGPSLTAPKPSVYVEATSTVKGLVGTGAQTFGGVKTFRAAPDFTTAGTTNLHYVDATTYGLKASNTGTQNNTAMALAIVAAVSAGQELHIPAGTFKFNFHGIGGTGAMVLTTSITVRGAGIGKTILKADGFVEGTYVGDNITNQNDNGSSLFRVSPNTGDVVLTDMTWQGPPVVSITGDNNVCWALWGGGGGTVRIERIDTLLWNQTIKFSPEYPAYPGVGTKFTAVDSHLGYRSSGAILHISGTDADKDSSDFIRVVFEYNDYGTPTVTMQPTSNGEYPCAYINTGVAFSAVDTWFKKSGRGTGATASAVGWLHYGSSYYNGQNNVPRYARCVNCLFDTGVEQIQMYTNSYATTQIMGSVFHTGEGDVGIEAAGPVVLNGTQFLGENGAGEAILDVSGHDVSITATNCVFGRYGQNDGYTIEVIRQTDGTQEWRFSHCEFNDIHAGGIQVQLQRGRVFLDSCVFQGTTGTYALVAQEGFAVLNDNVFKGLPIYADGNYGATTLELNRNRWDVSAQVQLQGAAGNTITVRGVDNRFYEGTAGKGEGFSIVNASGVSNITGSITSKPGVGAYIYASNILSISLNYDTYAIDEGGTPAINNIGMAGSSASGVVSNDHNRVHNSRIYLLVKQAFSLGSSGNIIAAAGTRIVNSVVTLQYFPALAKWVEI